jgi:hypothetical protein
MTAIGPVWPAEVLRAQRKAAPFRPLPEGPPMLTNVTFTEKDYTAHRTPPLDIPAPRPISLRERLDLGRPVTDTTALIPIALTVSLPEFSVTLQSYRQAELRTYT